MLSKAFALIVLTWFRVTLATYGSNETKTMPRLDQDLLGDAWQEGLDVIRVLWKDCSMKVRERTLYKTSSLWKVIRPFTGFREKRGGREERAFRIACQVCEEENFESFG